MYSVYVLFSENYGKTYTGFTSDLLNRMKSHNHYGTDGFTKNYRPWKLIHIEIFEGKLEAMKREKELKSGKGRLFIKTEILPIMKSVGFISA
jgi:putative endonuclease